jgi:hypothetical protein
LKTDDSNRRTPSRISLRCFRPDSRPQPKADRWIGQNSLRRSFVALLPWDERITKGGSFGACEEFSTTACQKCPTLINSVVQDRRVEGAVMISHPCLKPGRNPAVSAATVPSQPSTRLGARQRAGGRAECRAVHQCTGRRRKPGGATGIRVTRSPTGSTSGRHKLKSLRCCGYPRP